MFRGRRQTRCGDNLFYPRTKEVERLVSGKQYISSVTDE